MNLKEQYRRFRAWQKGPHPHSTKGLDEEYCCANCGHVFNGNYCPVCGQHGKNGRITWQSTWQNILMLWGMDSHSMPYSIFQLLLRPGYFIGEYISGRRQVSYPPVKMLFIVAVIYVFVKQLFGVDTTSPNNLGDGTEIIQVVFSWMVENPGWAMMTMTMLLTVPTWYLFHFAPRHTKHTLPEGVFIQLFMSTLMIMVAFAQNVIHSIFALLIPIYYYIAYRQLFGYSRWGTIWRLLICFAVWLWTVTIIAAIGILLSTEQIDNREMLITIATMVVAVLAVIAAHIAIGYWISKKTYKKRGNQ